MLKIGEMCVIRQHINKSLNTTAYSRRTLFWGKKKEEEPLPSTVIELEEPTPQLSEEDIMKIRDKSRLPPFIKREMTRSNPLPMRYLWQFTKKGAKQRWAMFGNDSQLNPGICWPNKEEIKYIKQYEQTFHPSLQEMVDKMRAKRDEERRAKLEREREVTENLKKLPKWKADFWAKYDRMHDELDAEKQKKEKMIQEVREYVGFDIDESDPRFDDALKRKQEEDVKAFKAERKQQKAKEALELLQTLANEAMEREKEEAARIDKIKSKEKKTDNNPEK